MANALHRSTGRLRRYHHVANQGAIALHAGHRARHTALNSGNDRGDFLYLSGSSLGQLAYLVGHHGKTAPLFAGSGGFDRCIQCQEIGLVSNLTNDRGDIADLLHLFRQRLNLLRGFTHANRNLFDPANGLLNTAPTLNRQIAGFRGAMVSSISARANVFDTDGQLLNCGR